MFRRSPKELERFSDLVLLVLRDPLKKRLDRGFGERLKRLSLLPACGVQREDEAAPVVFVGLLLDPTSLVESFNQSSDGPFCHARLLGKRRAVHGRRVQELQRDALGDADISAANRITFSHAEEATERE